MSPLARQLIGALLRGGAVSMSQVGVIERAQMQAAAMELGDMGIALSVSKQGDVRLAKVVDALDADELAARLSEIETLEVETLQIDLCTASTNADALAASPPSAEQCSVRMAEYQTAGQGRRGKVWSSPFATGLCISLALRMSADADLGRLPLAFGVGLRRALMQLGLARCQIKWPNDLIADGRKLGGLLLNARQLNSGDTLVVAGLGLNVYRAPPRANAQALIPTALAHWLGDQMPDRTTIAAALINAMRETADTYGRSGFAAFAADWPQADYLHNREIEVVDESTVSTGVARGIDDQGRLLMETYDGVVSLSGGDVSVRPVRPA
ncbi:MAG: biotin--[acetyl-CoA-carboxylase] ligase [Gammaproteobacteria bacterium]